MSMIGFLTSCSSTSSSSVNSTYGGVVNVANAMGEINNLLSGLGLSFSQNSIITSALTDYVTQYNSLSTLSPNSNQFQNKLKMIKSNTLSTLSSNLGPSQYNNFIKVLNNIGNSSSTNLSASTASVLSSLVN